MKERPLCSTFGRHKVVAVEKDVGGEVHLRVETWDSKREIKTVVLRDYWVDTIVEEGEKTDGLGSGTAEAAAVATSIKIVLQRKMI